MNGECIPKNALCNGVPDCNDASDEAGCSISNRCQPNEFKCINNKCVLKTWRCGEFTFLCKKKMVAEQQFILIILFFFGRR